MRSDVLCMAAVVSLCAAPALAQCPADPAPTGMIDEPGQNFEVREYAFVHSSTNLQGYPVHEKTAAGLFWNPPGMFSTTIPNVYRAFSSAVVVNNPSNAIPTTVFIDYFDPAGTLLATTGPHFIAPEGTHLEAATPLGLGTGVGSAVIRTQDASVDAPIVGASVHYFDSIGVPGWGIVEDPDWAGSGPGEGSYQQLQATPPDAAASLFGGPYRVTNMAPNDFENGSVPMFMIANPNPYPVTFQLAILAAGPTGIIAPLTTQTVTLNPRGMIFDDSMWQAVNVLTAGAAATVPPTQYDFDLIMVTVGEGPLVGDALVIDAFGDGAPANMNLGKRLRMVSSSLANNPTDQLIAIDVSNFTPPNGMAPMIDTAVHVCNAGLNSSGQVLVEYFDRVGNLLSTDTLPAPGLAPGATLHIGAGQAQTPGFPLGEWNGWLRVSADCDGDTLIGWTHREIGPAPAPFTNTQFRKAFGEELTGPNFNEPGEGMALVNVMDPNLPQGPFARKVMSLVRTFMPTAWWPGYTTFINDRSLANLGDYFYRFFDIFGFDVTNYSIQPFAGLAWGASSLSYEDREANFIGNCSGRVDRPTVDEGDLAEFDGINVLGDPFGEYGIVGDPKYPGAFATPGLGPTSMGDPGGDPTGGGGGGHGKGSDSNGG
jgi:hypothetical protein